MLFVKYSVDLEDEYPFIITTLFFTTILFLFFWKMFTVKYGKKIAISIGVWMMMPLVICQLFLDRVPRASYGLYLLFGIPGAVALLVPW